MKQSVYNGMSPIDLIVREMKERKLRNVDVSKMLDLSASSITATLQQKDISLDKLISCCHGFKYNFLEELANMLEYEGPAMEGEPKGNSQRHINALGIQINTLEKQNKSLQASLDEANEKLKILEVEHKVVKGILDKLIEGRA